MCIIRRAFVLPESGLHRLLPALQNVLFPATYWHFGQPSFSYKKRRKKAQEISKKMGIIYEETLPKTAVLCYN
jgi:hypothetical protein